MLSLFPSRSKNLVGNKVGYDRSFPKIWDCWGLGIEVLFSYFHFFFSFSIGFFHSRYWTLILNLKSIFCTFFFWCNDGKGKNFSKCFLKSKKVQPVALKNLGFGGWNCPFSTTGSKTNAGSLEQKLLQGTQFEIVPLKLWTINPDWFFFLRCFLVSRY